ncbi:hypothetical protein [Arthrobacter sp. NPDC090010]|uniref:hypothetical protein n=1 Tax=Arthrobacter sp. NPDC090010 TaxID=3363942 RepID=UPI0037F71292
MTENTNPEPVGFGIAELAFLLNSFEGPGHARSVDALGAGDWAGDEELANVGLSALAARGFVQPEEDGLGVSGAASLLAQTLGDGRLWITVEVGTADGENAKVVLVEQKELRLLLQPGIFSTWFATPLPEELTASQVAVSILHQHAEESPDSTATVSVATLERLSSYQLRRDGEGWEFAGITEDGPADPVSGLGPAEVAALFDAAAL